MAAAAEGDVDASPCSTTSPAGWPLGLVNLTNAFDPDGSCSAVGSSMAAAMLEPALRPALVRELLYASDLRAAARDLSFAELGERAGAIGAALLPAPGDAPASAAPSAPPAT